MTPRLRRSGRVSGFRRLLTALLTVGAVGSMKMLHAAVLSVPDREALVRQAAGNGGYASVMVTLEVLALETIKAVGSAAIREDTEKVAQGLRAQLGPRALQTGHWNNGMGQIGLLVTVEGLELLEQSGEVKAMQPDGTRGLRDRAWMTEDEQHAIEVALNAQGMAEVDVVLDSEIGYHIGTKGGSVYQVSGAAAAAHGGSLDAITAAATGTGLHWLNDEEARAGTSAVGRARIDRAAWHALLLAPQVRALRLGDSKASSWPQNVLEVAVANGGAEVVISLHGGDGFSPYQGYMSAAAWATQGQANTAAIHALLADAGAAAVARKVHAGIGAVSLYLSRQSLESLYTRRDPRVRAVELNRPIASPALSNSMPLINTPAAWAAGHRGAGQGIIVLDSGVRKDHQFFGDGAGNTRVTYEACFGTNNATHKSICPNPDGSGDSPLGLVNSGLPYADATYCAAQPAMCNHGTHVAGIAAGHSHASISPSGIQGTMPDAAIVAVQIYSYPITGTSWPNAYTADLLAALSAVYAATMPGVHNPYVVNASLAGSVYYGPCPDESPSANTAIANLLSRGVPVVAATGNNYSNNAMAFPACAPKTIKVSAVNNDGTGSTKLPKANIDNPVLYDGPMFLAPGGGVPEASVGVLSANRSSMTAMILASGTSMAAPHVSGFYAGAKADNPSASVADLSAWMAGPAASIPVTLPLPSGNYTFRRIRFGGP